MDPDDPFDTRRDLAAAGPRRVAAVAALALLGLVLVWLGLGAAPVEGRESHPLGRVALLALGVLALVGAEAVRRATARALILDRTGLHDDRGRMLARWEEIARVDRGAFAFKPSNGFVLHLTGRAPRGWAPGLWWRIGRRVGIGGVLNARASRVMAEEIAMRLALSRQGPGGGGRG
ncbi:hypothetical protein [Wenxinia saemankumensis]|uniref:PH domain-containing protein n=1 Tax=Wenxinia saemankumensis TaxID=1447782 RepID=A0A1M6GZ20_9RHOB|nr:hypothetical protein [Wenxinia saemankumensis]SHJ15218.1 hypothetical protein SAMN05444417_3012 [Wenxinia saemankumensis]